MSTPEERSNEDKIVAEVEKIARMAFGELSIEEYEAMLFRTGSMLAVFRAAMFDSGYTQYFIETVAWLIITSLYGHHLENQRIDFAPPASIYQAKAEAGGSQANGATQGQGTA